MNLTNNEYQMLLRSLWLEYFKKMKMKCSACDKISVGQCENCKIELCNTCVRYDDLSKILCWKCAGLCPDCKKNSPSMFCGYCKKFICNECNARGLCYYCYAKSFD